MKLLGVLLVWTGLLVFSVMVYQKTSYVDPNAGCFSYTGKCPESYSW